MAMAIVAGEVHTRARENRLPRASREETGRDERRGEISRARVRISPAPHRSFDTAQSSRA